MVAVLPFPLARRVGLIRKQAAWFQAQETRRGAERNLARLLEIQRQALSSKGVSAEAVEAEVAALNVAIRCEICRRIAGGEVG